MGKVKEATEKKEGQLISSDPLACIAYYQNRAIGVLKLSFFMFSTIVSCKPNIDLIQIIIKPLINIIVDVSASIASLRIDKGAAKRFVKSALWNPSGNLESSLL
ncbi:unnamed protein product [Porites evermanni]|uniref:Uncharacterized protein n=1 Tax=Porites evermanni TaxID=104178 RepID=A0ABN8Q435_9CNID|nr:unnamed protein product [Porites evermanni]